MYIIEYWKRKISLSVLCLSIGGNIARPEWKLRRVSEPYIVGIIDNSDLCHLVCPSGVDRRNSIVF